MEVKELIQGDGTSPSKWQQLKDFFTSREVILFILGALLISFVIPWIFQVFSDDQKELDLKASLTDRMSISIMKPMGLIQIYEQVQRGNYPGNISEFEENITAEQINLMQSIRTIQSQLSIYFLDNNRDLTNEWNNVGSGMYNFVLLSLTSDPMKRGDLADQVYRSLKVPVNSTVIDLIKNRNGDHYGNVYFELQGEIKKSFDDLILDLRNANIREYNTWNTFKSLYFI